MIETIITGDLGVNTYLFNYKENKAVIIDPGDEAGKITDRVNSLKLEITGIILTHGHFDHIGALNEIKAEYNVPIYVHSGDATFIGENSRDRHIEMFEPMGPQGAFYVNSYFKVTPEADVILEDKQVLDNFGIKVLHTPGHSPGSICLYSQDKEVVFTGDTLFKNGLGRTDFGGGNYATLLKSLEYLFELPGNTTAYPGHGGSTTLNDEDKPMPMY